MATCSSLRHLFERPRPENPTLMESISWSQISAAKHAHAAGAASFTEIFGELHFEEGRSAACPARSAPPSSPASDRCPPSGGAAEEDRCAEEEEDLFPGSTPKSGGGGGGGGGACSHPSSDSPTAGDECKSGPGEKGIVSRMRRSDSLRLCTEGLGSESSDVVVEDPMAALEDAEAAGVVTKRRYLRTLSEVWPRARGQYPPPISCIGSGGWPWVSFRSYREDGRFVLREVKIPGQELLRASREGGRLKLHFVHPEEEAALEEEGGRGEDGDVAHGEGDGGVDGNGVN